jgi:DNA primase
MGSRIPESAVDEVLARTDIRSVIEPYVKLTLRGGRWVGLCPFHNEKTPSFHVSPDRGLFHCFGCKAGGSALQFLMQIEGWSFLDTVKELARRAGVHLPEPDDVDERAAKKARDDKERFFRTMERATRFYEEQLLRAREAQAARDYLKSRGVDAETAKSFRLGYAPDAWSGLLDALRRERIDEATLEAAGLVLQRKQGRGHYDRFRDRVMFPVIDAMGKVVAFSGRTLSREETQKYINSPELAYFKKGEHLYGLAAAKAALRTDKEALVVEGNFDVVTLHAAGFRTAVAPLGTALTEAQIRLLKRVCERIVLVFDGDRAGQAAMLKALGPCYAAGLPVRAAVLPEGADPDSLVRAQGAEALRALLEHARPLADVALDGVVGPAVGGNPDERVEAARKAGEVLALLPQGALRGAYETEVGRRLEIELGNLPAPSGPTGRSRFDGDAEGDVPAVFEPLPAIERMLVQILLTEPQHAEHVDIERHFFDDLRPALRLFLSRVADAVYEEGERVRVERLVDELEEPLRSQVLEAISGAREYDTRLQPIETTLRQLQKRHVLGLKRELREALRVAEQRGDDALFARLLERDKRLTSELKDLSRPKL